MLSGILPKWVCMTSGNVLIEFGILALFGLVGVVVLLSAVGRLRAWLGLRRSEAETPRTVDPGHTEIEGTAKPLDRTLDAPEERTDCLAYHHVIKEKERRPDPDGPGTETEWETRKNEKRSVPFVVAADGAEVVVDPDDATYLLETSVSERRGDRKITVDRLDVGEPAYVAGQVVPARESGVATDGQRYVVESPTTWVPSLLRRLYDKPFVLSDAKEGTAERRLLWSSVKLFGFAVVWLGIVGAIGLQVVGA